MKPRELVRFHELLHQLWTKAVDTKDYDKQEWKELDRLIDNLGREQVGDVSGGWLAEAQRRWLE